MLSSSNLLFSFSNSSRITRSRIRLTARRCLRPSWQSLNNPVKASSYRPPAYPLWKARGLSDAAAQTTSTTSDVRRWSNLSSEAARAEAATPTTGLMKVTAVVIRMLQRAIAMTSLLEANTVRKADISRTMQQYRAEASYPASETAFSSSNSPPQLHQQEQIMPMPTTADLLTAPSLIRIRTLQPAPIKWLLLPIAPQQLDIISIASTRTPKTT